MRIGLVGTGHWARTVHARAIEDHPSHQLAGVWGRSADRTAALAADLGTTAFDSFEQLLDGVDAVAFATDPEQQADLESSALAAGKELVLDKPAALASRAARDLLRAAEEAGRTVKVFHTARYRPEIEGWIREVRTTAWDRGRGWWIGDALLNEGGPYFASAWRRQRGPLWDAGPHAMSILLPIFGSVPAVRGVRREGPVLSIDLEFESAAATIDLSVASPTEDGRLDLELEGAAGRSEMPRIVTPPWEAYGRLLDGFGHDGDVRDLALGADGVEALERVEAMQQTTGTEQW